MLQAFGDSITAGLGASVPACCWLRRLDPVNRGVSGAQAADLANLAIQQTPHANGLYAVSIGANDVYKYKDDLIKQAFFRKCLTAAVAWLSLPTKTLAKDLTQIGAWHPTSSLVNPHGLATSTNGGKLHGTVTGPQLVVGYTIQDFWKTVGTASVKVGGVVVGYFSCDGNGMTTHLGATWGAAATVFNTGLSDGESALVEIEMVSANDTYFYCDWMASVEQIKPRVIVSTILERSAAAYAAHQISSQTTAAHNAIIRDVAAKFSNVVLVDNHAAIDPLVHLADGVHPNDAGHALLASNFRAAALGL